MLLGAELNERVFRNALSYYASGITVITGNDDDTLIGFTCQSFFSVSVSPPLVAFSVNRTSKSWPKIRGLGGFAINVLRAGQEDISDGFAKSEGDRWEGVQWSRSALGNPAIENALLRLDCELYAEHEAGDHTIVISRVRSISRPEAENESGPLVFFRGSYCSLAS